MFMFVGKAIWVYDYPKQQKNCSLLFFFLLFSFFFFLSSIYASHILIPHMLELKQKRRNEMHREINSRSSHQKTMQEIIDRKRCARTFVITGLTSGVIGLQRVKHVQHVLGPYAAHLENELVITVFFGYVCLCLFV